MVAAKRTEFYLPLSLLSEQTAHCQFGYIALKNSLVLMINLDSILKSSNITLSTKVSLVKAMVFPVVVWMSELDYKES